MNEKQVDELRLEGLDNGAHLAYHTTVSGWAKADETISAKCPKFITPYDTSLAEEDRVIKTSPKSLLTDQIVTSDRLRDEFYRSYRDMVKAMDGIAIPEMAEAAKILQQHIKDYKIDVQSQLDKETGNLLSFTNDLKDKYADQVAALNLTNIVEKLAEANDQTAELLRQRDIENKAREVGATKRVRAQVDEAYRRLIQVINAYALIEGDANYANFIDQMNSLIKRYKQQILGQSTSSDKGEGGNEPTPEPTHEITAFYPKEGANPDKPLEFPRNKPAVLEGKGLKLVNSPEGKKAQLVLINYVEQRMPHEDSALLLNTDEKIEFTMMYDAAEGQYNFQIETYPDGTEEAVIIKYPETITLV